MGDFVIRQATAADAFAIFTVVRANAHDGQLMLVPLDRIRKGIGEYMVASVDGAIVGCCALHDHGKGIYELCSLSVLKEYQAGGIGTRLARESLGAAGSRSLVFLGTDKPGFYERLGFKPMKPKHLPIGVWIGKTRNLLHQDLREWPKIFSTRYTFMERAK
ncbi:MAG TPA: GNAT family N-acetyltransferase [Rectinemataceae bacterium]|nr:GNAT family N-acetyltransferase [Rectinemataceae bacterium]